MRWKVFDPPSKEQMYDDEDYWEVSFFPLVVVIDRE